MGQGLRLVMLTGVRVTELAGAEIKEFERLDDAKNATWTIPAARSKNGKAHVVPLSRLALSIVLDLVERATALAGEHSPPRFVFVSPNDPKKPIDGHAFSVAMIRFGNALSVAADSKNYGFDEVRAIPLGLQTGRPLTTCAALSRHGWQDQASLLRTYLPV
jgi:integrase